MGNFFQHYGVEDERRGRVIRNIVYSVAGLIILAVLSYFVLHDYSEKRVAYRFLAAVNEGHLEEAYKEWCTPAHPCPNYDYQRFLQDWGPTKKVSSPWKVASLDSCQAFLTVNVQAGGTDLESLSVQRNDHSLGFAPAPECQERKWRWKQFFQRMFGGGESKS